MLERAVGENRIPLKLVEYVRPVGEAVTNIWGRFRRRPIEIIHPAEEGKLAKVVTFPLPDMDARLASYRELKTLPGLLADLGGNPQDFRFQTHERQNLVGSQLWIDHRSTIRTGFNFKASIPEDDEGIQSLKHTRRNAQRRYRYHLNRKGEEHTDVQLRLREYQQTTIDLFDRLNIQNQERINSQIQEIKARTLAERLREDPQNFGEYPAAIEIAQASNSSDERGRKRIWNSLTSRLQALKPEVNLPMIGRSVRRMAAPLLLVGALLLSPSVADIAAVNLAHAGRLGAELTKVHRKIDSQGQKYWVLSELSYRAPIDDFSRINGINKRIASVTNALNQSAWKQGHSAEDCLVDQPLTTLLTGFLNSFAREQDQSRSDDCSIGQTVPIYRILTRDQVSEVQDLAAIPADQETTFQEALKRYER